MQTKEIKSVTETNQSIQLVEGEFTPSEATHVIISLLNEKINFHKLQRLQVCEGNQYSDTGYTDARIKELENEKRIAKEFISDMRSHGRNLIIHGKLEISLAE